MESIIWFLVIGGCGAHVGGHGGHGGGREGHMGQEEESSAGSKTAKDPVCGMEIDKDQAYAMTRREGRQFYKKTR
jgi:hypothetical protein